MPARKSEPVVPESEPIEVPEADGAPGIDAPVLTTDIEVDEPAEVDLSGRTLLESPTGIRTEVPNSILESLLDSGYTVV